MTESNAVVRDEYGDEITREVCPKCGSRLHFDRKLGLLYCATRGCKFCKIVGGWR